MNFDIGEVLSRAWQITWKHKVLWIIGLVFGVLVSAMFLLLIIPAFLPVLLQNSRTNLTPVILFLAGFGIVFLLFVLALYPISVLTQTSLTLDILDANEGNEPLSVRELIKKSLPFFWRVLGLMVLFAAGVGLINLIIQVVIILLTVVTLGIATICMIPLMLLMYPALYAAIVWMEQAMNGIIVDNLTVLEAAKQGWSLLRNNILPVALMALVVYVGVGMISMVVVMPLMIPLFLVPFGFLEQPINWTILSISIVCVIAFIPLFAVFTGWSMIFSKSAWVITYLRLTRSPKLQPILAEAIS